MATIEVTEFRAVPHAAGAATPAVALPELATTRIDTTGTTTVVLRSDTEMVRIWVVSATNAPRLSGIAAVSSSGLTLSTTAQEYFAVHGGMTLHFADVA